MRKATQKSTSVSIGIKSLALVPVAPTLVMRGDTFGFAQNGMEIHTWLVCTDALLTKPSITCPSTITGHEHMLLMYLSCCQADRHRQLETTHAVAPWVLTRPLATSNLIQHVDAADTKTPALHPVVCRHAAQHSCADLATVDWVLPVRNMIQICAHS